MKAHQLDYSLAMMNPKFDGGQYLHTKYATMSKSIYPAALKVNYGYTPAMAIGFWLRRGIDGSAPIIWAALKAFLKRFDPKLSQEVNQALSPKSTVH